jgi:ribosomal protein S18 acetylase RimI-like enzyme
MTPVEIRPARFPHDTDAVRAIFREYAASLGIDLGFQDFETELAELPGKYAAPRGQVLLACADGRIVGCVALRPLDETTCEMKRLYVRPAGRGQNLGRQMAVLICQFAKLAGYTSIRLDTLPSMQAARQIYAALGFKPISAYIYNPIPGAIYLELDLAGQSGAMVDG